MRASIAQAGIYGHSRGLVSIHSLSASMHPSYLCEPFLAQTTAFLDVFGTACGSRNEVQNLSPTFSF